MSALKNYGHIRPLEALGISEAQERAYRHLLAHPGATATEITASLEISTSNTRNLLSALENMGLATQTLGTPRQYFPSAPDVAIEALVHHRREAVENALGIIPELQSSAAVQSTSQRPIVEFLHNQDVTRQAFAQIPQLAQREIINIARPPVVITRLNLPDSEDRPTQRDALQRGVRFRSIVDSELLSEPGVPQALRDDLSAGEEIRVAQNVPARMFIADYRIGLITLNPENPDGPALLLRSRSLLTAMYELFEYLWEYATPLPFADSASPVSTSESQANHGLTRELHELLAAGIPDKAIVEELGISRRTLVRRLSEWMDELGARSRYQAGWLAAKRESALTLGKRK